MVPPGQDCSVQADAKPKTLFLCLGKGKRLNSLWSRWRTQGTQMTNQPDEVTNWMKSEEKQLLGLCNHQVGNVFLQTPAYKLCIVPHLTCSMITVVVWTWRLLRGTPQANHVYLCSLCGHDLTAPRACILDMGLLGICYINIRFQETWRNS